MDKYYFKIARAWVWLKDDGGDGVRRNINETIPEKALENSNLIKQLLSERVIELRVKETNERLATEHDFVDMEQSDIEFISKNSNWQKMVEKIGFTNYKPSVLKKLKTAIGMNPSYVNKDMVVKSIDDKLNIYNSLYKDIVDIEELILEDKAKSKKK